MGKDRGKLLLFLLLIGAFLVRVWRLDQLLAFYFDQGRDALVIWRFLHEGDLFLVGPTTGIEGILRGPWYYWLITPFYLLGGGNPVWPAVFLAFTSILAIAILYYLAQQLGGKRAGFLAVIISGFSYYLVLASRWLSNPTPMLLISMLLIWALFQVLEKKRWAWVLIGFLLGMAMQFGSAAEVFYFPAVGLFAIWQRDKLPDRKLLFVSAGTLFMAFVPQIVFDIIHNGVLSSAIKKFLFEQESFKASFWEVVQQRIVFYYQVFFQKLFPITSRYWGPFLAIFLFAFLAGGRLLAQKKFITLLLVFISPLVGMLFFQGNQGYIFDYYFTGYYLVFILIFSVVLANFSKHGLGLILVGLFLLAFTKDNIPLLRNYLVAGVDGPTHITLGNQMQAVDWVFEDAKGQEFNVDVYVPPVIPHAYDYLFLWQGTQRCGESLCGLQLEKRIPLLYTLYEVDPPHPERLEAWLARQAGIGVVEEEKKFGGITVQRRQRTDNEQ